MMMLSLVMLCALSTFASDEARPAQIVWLPDLEVAKRIAQEEGRPLLLAFNMDGESASERIVREQYRDPTFVAATNRCVCVIGSVFRHNPRDYDDQGRRIPCPRLGRVTCGEHIALEPLLFEMLQGERIAPRHALILANGEKKFDHSLLFDLRDLETSLYDGVKDAPIAKETPTSPSSTFDVWNGLFISGLTKQPANRATVFESLARNAIKLGFAPQAADAARTALFDCAKLPVGMTPPPPSGLFEFLALLDRENPLTRFSVLAHRAVNSAGAKEALPKLYPADVTAAIEDRIVAVGGTLDVSVLLSYARAYRIEGKIEPRSTPPRPAIDVIEARIATAVAALKANQDDPATMLELGRASLECARAKIDDGGDGIDLHLADAQMYLGQAEQKLPEDLDVQIELARLAYVQGRYEDEERIALSIESKLPPLPNLLQSDRATVAAALREPMQRHEALRWIGDAEARLVNSRYGKDPAVQVEGMIRGARALLTAALSPHSDPVDWESAISFFNLLGLRSSALLIAEEGAQRFPKAAEIRSAARDVVRKLGRPELAVEFSQRELNRDPKLAEHPWYLGVDIAQFAEWQRRMERPEEAVAQYGRAIASFQRCADLEPSYVGAVRRQQALAARGKGFAFLLGEKQQEAAAALVESASLDPTIVAERDGLDRDTYDLVDNVVEYRIGRPSPVDPVRLLAQIEAAAPQDAFWPRALADAMLREALRSDGRHDEKDGDRCMGLAIGIAKRAYDIDPNDVDNRWIYAQCATVHAERVLARNDAATARDCLALAAPVYELDAPAADAGSDSLAPLAAKLRDRLGEARPRNRPGR